MGVLSVYEQIIDLRNEKDKRSNYTWFIFMNTLHEYLYEVLNYDFY